MADHSIGKIFVELDLDPSKYTKAQQAIQRDASVVALNIEKNYQTLGTKSSAMFDLMRARIDNAYQGILHSSKSTANDILRAEEAKNAKLKSLNEQQYGAHTSLIESLKKNWMAITAVIGSAMAAVYTTKRIYDFGRNIATLTNDIERNASVLGLSIAEYQKWTYAAKMADVSTESLMTGIKFLSRNMEDANRGIGDAKKYFDALGIKGKTTAEIMMEIADRFKGAGDSSEQAARKIDYAMAIAGRGGMELIPLWNLGREGIKKYMDEAVKMGTVLGDVTVKKGGEAESTFKRLEAQINATKLSLAPVALAFANFFADIIKDAKGAIETIGGIVEAVKGASKRVWESQEEWRKKRGYPESNLGIQLGIKTPSGISTPGEEAERYGGRIPTIPQIPLPPIPNAEEEKKRVEALYHQLMELNKLREEAAQIAAKYVEIQSDEIVGYDAIYDKVGKVIALAARYESRIIPIEDIYAQEKKQEEAREKIIRGEVEFNQMRIDAGSAVYQEQLDRDMEWVKMHEYAQQKILEGEQQMAQDIIEAWAFVYENQKNIDMKRYEDLVKLSDSVAEEMGRAFQSGFFDLFKTGEDKWKSFVENMVNSFLRGLSQMASNYIMFGDLMGSKGGTSFFGTSVGGYGGIIGGLLSFLHLQEGGSFWTHGPTPIVAGEGGESEFVNITPKSKMGTKGGGSPIIYIINPIGFDEALMRHLGLVVKGVQKNLNTAGGLARG